MIYYPSLFIFTSKFTIMKKLILSTFTVLAVISLSCKKEKSCNQEQADLTSAQTNYNNFSDSIGMCNTCDIDTVQVHAEYTGSGNWFIPSTGYTVYIEGYGSLAVKNKWTSLRSLYDTKQNIYNTCNN